MTMHTQIFFNQLLISMYLYQNTKNQNFSSFSSRDIIDLKIHLIGQDHFDSHLRNQNFVKHEICVSLQQLIKTFIIDQIEIKLMTKFSYIFKELQDRPNFPHFAGQNIIFGKSSSVMHNATQTANIMLSPRKNERDNSKKTSQEKDRQTLSIGTFWPRPGVQ